MEDYQYEATEEGCGHGAICAPIIANIYMHYVLIWWYKERVKTQMRGYSGLVVYADDTEIETMPKLFIEFNIHKDLCMGLSV